jgi:hypothetical protein
MARRPKFSGTDEPDAERTDLRQRARKGARDAMDGLLRLATGAESESVKLAAIKELLDRGFGRVGQIDQAGTVVAHLLINDGYEG